MSCQLSPDPVPRKLFWTGTVLSVLPALLMFFSAYMKFAKPPEVVEGFKHLEFPIHLATFVGILEIACTVLFLIPQTAVLGAILLAAYLGGATVTHLRVGDPYFMPPLLGVIFWLGLLLRDRRLWSLLPLRRPLPTTAQPT